MTCLEGNVLAKKSAKQFAKIIFASIPHLTYIFPTRRQQHKTKTPLSSIMTKTKYTSKLHDARVVIFGGTSGIGFCVAEAAIEHGAHVCICGSKQIKLEKAVSHLQSSYPDSASKIVGHICDLWVHDAIEHNIETVLKFATADAKIDHIVYTAGDAIPMIPLADATTQSILRAGLVRFLGPLMLGKVAPQYMSAGPKSSITLTGGTISRKPPKGLTVMAAWGSGREGIMRGLAVDLAPIRVNMVSPGAVHTEAFDAIPNEVLESVLQEYRDGTLVNQMGTPENLAEAYLYAMKDQFVTGKNLESDGGKLLK